MNSVGVGHSHSQDGGDQLHVLVRLRFQSTVQIKVSLSLVIALTLSGQGGGDRLHVLVVGHAALAVGPVLEDRLHDGGHGEEGGRRGDAGIGMRAFLSVYIHSVRRL